MDEEEKSGGLEAFNANTRGGRHNNNNTKFTKGNCNTVVRKERTQILRLFPEPKVEEV